MQAHRVAISPSAAVDLYAIYRHVLGRSGRARAEDLLADLIAACRQMRDFPLRGSRRDDLRPGVRTIS